MPELHWPWLLLLWPLPWVLWHLRPPHPQRTAPALRLPQQGLAVTGRPPGRARAGRIALLPMLAWTLLVLAAARPQWLEPAQPEPHQARELVLAVDLSGSMAEADMRLGGRPVDRLTAVKAVLEDFLDRRVGDHIGLVVFGTRAYTLTPLTPDLGTVREQLAGMDIAMAGRETAIGDAIALSVRRLRETAEIESGRPPVPGSRVVVLLTDGVSNAGVIEPLQAAELARAEGVKVHTVAFGREGGAQSLFGMVLPRAEADIDEAALQAISDTTGGRFFRARDTAELAGIYAELDRLEARAQDPLVLQVRRELFAWPLALALLAGLLVLVGPSRARRVAA